MKGLRLYQFLCLMVLLLSVGCSTQKNNALTRFYHELNSEYNVYFNARESVKEGLKRIEQQVVEDYTHLLPVFPEASVAASQVAFSQMEYAVQKCQKLIANHSITASPRRKPNNSESYKAFASKGEYNKWVDDAYLLMGEASYYQRDFHKAEESFNYILHNFATQPTRNPAFLWLSRCYLETGEFEKALQIYKLLERDGNLPEQIKKELTVVKTDYQIRRNNWKEAIFQLNQLLKFRLTKKEKGRFNFILAQLYLREGQNEEAIAALNRVLKSHPDPRISFEAKISLLEYAGNKGEEINQSLARMIRNGSNRPYLDRIYYAKGKVSLQSGNRSQACRDFQSSVQYSIDNNSQRALSSLTVARLFFEDNNYRLSACYYDSALAVIGQDYPDYEEVVTKTNGLAGLVRNLDNVVREDSLQRIASMTEQNRLAFIELLITKVTAEEARKQKEEQQELSDRNYFRGQQYRQGSPSQGSSNLWYFYNPVTAGLGKTEFQQIWGKRKLEDNWRRKNKISLNPGEGDLQDLTSDNSNKNNLKPKESNPKSVAYYLQDLPLTDSLMRASHDKIKSSLFAAGRIYATILKDEPHAIALFEELNKRYPGSIYELPTWIEFHRMKYKAALYQGQITQKYPESNYAKFLLNPNFFREMEQLKVTAEHRYEQAMVLYRKGDYQAAGEIAEEVIHLQPDSLLLPKARFIAMVSKGKKAGKEEFAKMIDQYIADNPQSVVNPTALKIRELIRQNSLAELEKMIARMDSAEVDKRNKLPKNRQDDPFGGKFSYDEELFHYFIIAYPRNAKVDVNRLIFDIANFNIDYYTSIDFDIEEIKLNDQTTMVVVRSLPNKEEGLGYFGNILKQKGVFKTLKDVDYHYFIASSPNYRKLIEDQDLLEYLRFFVENYSKNSAPVQ